MTQRIPSRRWWTAGLSILAALGVAGCILIPYPLTPRVERVEEVRVAQDVLVSAGPRRQLEGISERLQEARPGLSVVDPITFRDAAFPGGGWRLQELLEPARCRRLAEDLRVRFLVLIGSGATDAHDLMGLAFPIMLPVAAMGAGETSVLSAVVFDLETGEPACRLRSQAGGPGVFLAWVIYVAAVVPLTERAAQRGLADAIAETLAAEAGSGPLRIAVMAAEASGDPFVAYEGAPIPVWRDFAVAEMVNRLANVEADVVPGVTSRDDLRALLGAPRASHQDLRVDVYRFAAVAEKDTSPLFVFWDVDWTTREERPYVGYLLISHDEEGKVIDLASAIVAAAVAPPEPPSMLESPTRSGYTYAFEPSDVAAVPGFRLEVEHGDQGVSEALYTEPDGVLVFADGEWLRPEGR